MILGRARKLEWTSLRNSPRGADGAPNWANFEQGPPAYICEFLSALERRAQATLPRMLRAQRDLGLPTWEDIVPCDADPDNEGRFLYNPASSKRIYKVVVFYCVVGLS